MCSQSFYEVLSLIECRNCIGKPSSTRHLELYNNMASFIMNLLLLLRIDRCSGGMEAFLQLPAVQLHILYLFVFIIFEFKIKECLRCSLNRVYVTTYLLIIVRSQVFIFILF